MRWQRSIGWHDQVPPPTSAKRIGGERAYLKVHRGETVLMPPSQVYLHEARWLTHDLPRQSKLRVTMRGGYYVRSLARDLGRLVGCGGASERPAAHRHRALADPGLGGAVAITGRDVMPWAPLRILEDAESANSVAGEPSPSASCKAHPGPFPTAFPRRRRRCADFTRSDFASCCLWKNQRLRRLAALPGGM